MKTIFTILFLFISIQVFSQVSNSENKTVVNNKNTNEVNSNTELKQYNGPWTLGLNLGIPIVSGDMDSRLGYGFSATIQKSLSPMFALRFQALALETYGLDKKKYGGRYSNFKTRFTDYTLQGVVTLNNLSFYYKEPKVLINLIAGGGFATKYVMTNLYDNSGKAYTYESFSGSSAETIQAVNNMTDDNYETTLVPDKNNAKINNTSILPTFVFGGGLVFKLVENVDLNIETRVSIHHSDGLDGHYRGIASDWLSFTSLGLIIRLGKGGNKDTRWSNPLHKSIEKIENTENTIVDTDNDGVADVYDLDNYTPPNANVNTKGVALDTDKDGVPDYKDSELFSPLGAKVDKKGFAIDTDKDGIPDVLDLEKNTAPNNQVDSRGRTINSSSSRSTSTDKKDIEVPTKYVFFDINSSVVKEEFYPRLFEMSRFVNDDSSAKIILTGYTDKSASRNYNLNLSKKRTEAVEKLLVRTFKVNESQIVKNYHGEDKPIVDDSVANATSSYINRRVEVNIGFGNATDSSVKSRNSSRTTPKSENANENIINNGSENNNKSKKEGKTLLNDFNFTF